MNRITEINNALKQMKETASEREHSLYSSESVGRGHPDKMADQISDLVVDAFLSRDRHARVAVETAVKDSEIMVFGEVNSAALEVPSLLPKLIKRHVYENIGFRNDSAGLNGENCAVSLRLGQQAEEIELGTKDASIVGSELQGAGDQGVMYGYACNETPELMPLPIMLSHKLVKALNEYMFLAPGCGLRPDNKALFTLEYDKSHLPVRIASIIVAQQHAPTTSHEQLEKLVKARVLEVVDHNLMDDDTLLIVNGTGGTFVTGGPKADAGLTGRKIIVDTYGGVGRHGGGAFSGKDPSKVDRSAAYISRFLAKQLVANGYASKAEVQLSYCIGLAEPVSVNVNTFNTGGGVLDTLLAKKLIESFDLRPAGIIEFLDLKNQSYLPTATYGHFGWDNYTWEKVQNI